MLKGKDYTVLEIVFPFVYVYSHDWMVLEEDAHLTHIHVLYTEIDNGLMSNNYSREWSTDDVNAKRSSAWAFKISFWCLFGAYFENYLIALKFHPLDYCVGDLDIFATVSILSSSTL